MTFGALSITKPSVGGSNNTCGTELNAALDAIVTDINGNTPYSLLLSSTQSLTSSTTLQGGFSIAGLVANAYYVAHVNAVVGGNSGGDVKAAWSYSGTLANSSRFFCAPQAATTDHTNTAVHRRAVSSDITTELAGGLDGSTDMWLEDKVIIKTSTTGTLAWKWAQNTSNASQTVVKTGSSIVLTQMR